MHYFNTASLTFTFFISACAYQQVSYERNIAPIINNKCNSCHTAPNGFGYITTGLMTDSYDGLMMGSIYGPIIVSGDSRRSILNKIVEGRTSNMCKTPNNEDRLSNEDIRILNVWVNQGALDN